MFDANAMAELAHLKADRYQRSGGGGAFKVYQSAKTYYEAKGINEMSAWDRLMLETTTRWQQAQALASEQFRIACLTSQEGFYYGDEIPF